MWLVAYGAPQRISASRCLYQAGNTRSLSEHGSQAAWADDSALRESRLVPGHSSTAPIVHMGLPELLSFREPVLKGAWTWSAPGLGVRLGDGVS